jgi:threonine dehydrogenase-like Zn-dependent dehydrogenase
VASGRVQLEQFTQHRFPLERIQDACEAALGKHDRLLKALVECWGIVSASSVLADPWGRY